MFPTSDLNFTEQITPFLPLLGVVAGALIVGAFAIWNRRRGNVETKAPSVAEIWAREERLARHARRLERLIDILRPSFHGYVERVQAGGSPALTPQERIAHDAEPPVLDE